MQNTSSASIVWFISALGLKYEVKNFIHISLTSYKSEPHKVKSILRYSALQLSSCDPVIPNTQCISKLQGWNKREVLLQKRNKTDWRSNRCRANSINPFRSSTVLLSLIFCLPDLEGWQGNTREQQDSLTVALLLGLIPASHSLPQPSAA